MMNQETLDKIEKLEKAISSTKTPDSLKEKMRQALETLKSEKVEVVEPSLANEVKTITKYTDIKSCLLDDGDDNDDYIYEGKHIHNVETLPKDTWEIVEFYNDGVVLKHIPTSVLADNKPNKNVSFSELKTLFAVGKIEIDGIENGNTKVFNLCIKAIVKCISNIDEIANKQAVISELTSVKNDLEKNIEKANALENEKSELLNKNSDLEKTSTDKISSLESSISDEKSSFEKAKIMADLETANLKKKLEDLEALNVVRSVIDMLNDDVMKKDLKELRNSDKEPKVEQIFPKQEGLKYKSGDFVFANIFKDPNKKVPFIVSDFSNGKYYILGDGSHFVSEDKLSLATEKDFDEYYGESADSFKVFNSSIIDSDINLLGNPKEPYLLTAEQFSSLIEEKNKILGRDYAKLKPLFEKYSVIKNGYDKIKEDVFSNPLLAYHIAHQSEKSMGYADTSHLDRNKIKTENAKYLIDNIDKYPTNNEFKKYIKLIYFSNQKSNENYKNIVEDALRLSYKGNETPEQSKSDYVRAIENGEVSLDDVLFILNESKVKPTKELENYNSKKYSIGGEVDKDSRIDKMVKSWNEQGKAWSHINNDDNEFFERIGIPYEKIGTSSNTGTDLIYYDTDRYDFDARRKLEKGGGIFSFLENDNKSGFNKDHKYFNERENHEVDYAEKTGREKLTYDKFENGGEINPILKEFNELTATNNHDDAAILLAENFGTDEEVARLQRIRSENDRRGYSDEQERKEMDAISNKYYYRLKKESNIDSVSMNRLKNEFAKEPEIFSGSVVKRGGNEFKIDGDFFYMKTPDSDWKKFRQIK